LHHINPIHPILNQAARPIETYDRQTW